LVFCLPLRSAFRSQRQRQLCCKSQTQLPSSTLTSPTLASPDTRPSSPVSARETTSDPAYFSMSSDALVSIQVRSLCGSSSKSQRDKKKKKRDKQHLPGKMPSSKQALSQFASKSYKKTAPCPSLAPPPSQVRQLQPAGDESTRSIRHAFDGARPLRPNPSPTPTPSLRLRRPITRPSTRPSLPLSLWLLLQRRPAIPERRSINPLAAYFKPDTPQCQKLVLHPLRLVVESVSGDGHLVTPAAIVGVDVHDVVAVVSQFLCVTVLVRTDETGLEWFVKRRGDETNRGWIRIPSHIVCSAPRGLLLRLLTRARARLRPHQRQDRLVLGLSIR
jgi:hypothetical protein